MTLISGLLVFNIVSVGIGQARQNVLAAGINLSTRSGFPADIADAGNLAIFQQKIAADFNSRIAGHDATIADNQIS